MGLLNISLDELWSMHNFFTCGIDSGDVFLIFNGDVFLF